MFSRVLKIAVVAVLGFFSLPTETSFTFNYDSLERFDLTHIPNFHHHHEQFLDYIHHHNKNYKNINEHVKRFEIFVDNSLLIEKHNCKNLSYSLAINYFADMTNEEYRSLLLPKRLEKRSSSLFRTDLSNTTIPTDLDWRVASKNPKGIVAVTPVKNQLQCGSCYAHAAAESTESAMAISGFQLNQLSPQQIVDCSDVPPYNNAGCNGGNPSTTFQYIVDKGLCLASDYPYTATQGTCKKCNPVGHLNGYTDIANGDENGIVTELQKGPVNIAIEADQAVFQFYSSGVFDDASCGTNLDHAVNLVGYGTDTGKDYFILRNSWGTTWGENGYMRIIRNKNMCGLSEMAQRGYYTNKDQVLIDKFNFNWDLLYECVGECGYDIVKDIIQCSGDLAKVWDILKCAQSIVGTVSPCYKCIQGILSNF